MTKKTAENTAPHKKRGPKPVEIKMDQLVVLAGMQCTYEEIAAVFGIKKRQFIDRVNADPELKEAIEEGWAKGRMSIRREQFKLLQDGNPTMAVWLGKQYCRQRDQIGIGNPDGSANSSAENLETRVLLSILNEELKDAPEVRYRIAQRLHAIQQESSKVQ